MFFLGTTLLKKKKGTNFEFYFQDDGISWTANY